MRYTVFVFAGLLWTAGPTSAQPAALHATPPVAVGLRTTLPIHPQHQGLTRFSVDMPPVWQPQEQFMAVPVDQPTGLSAVSVMQGVQIQRPPDQAHFYQYNRPVFPLVQF